MMYLEIKRKYGRQESALGRQSGYWSIAGYVTQIQNTQKNAPGVFMGRRMVVFS
jgi:hypothetical protein